MNNQYFNPYFWQQPSQNFQSQRIQNLSSVISTEVQCFYVNSPSDMEKIQPTLNTLYIGINSDKKEIYLRQMNNNGLIDFTTYTQLSGEQQKSEFSKILDRLDQLETNLKGKDNAKYTNGASANGYADKRFIEESPANATIQSNDGGKIIRGTERNDY